MSANPCKCCCGKCHYALNCDDCCGCIPKEICVSVVGTGTDCTCAQVQFDIAEYDCYSETWSGVVLCGDISFDYTVYIQADSDGKCYLYLDSDCLASTLSDGLNEPRDNPADEYGSKCKTLSAAWTGVSHTCGDTNCTTIDITVDAADRYEVPTNCAGDCENCRCACNTLCVSVSSDDCIVTTTTSGGNGTWTFSVDCNGTTISGTITLAADSNGDCALSISTTEGDGGEIVQNNCPQLDGSWTFGAYDEITIQVRCKECGDCSSQEIGCCDLAASCPNPLTVSFCNCDVTIPLDNTEACFSWGGSPICNGETWNIDFYCINSGGKVSDDIYRLSIGCDAMSPNQVVAYATQVSCDPFVVLFNVDMGSYTGDCTECDGTFPVMVTG